jgi:tryptophan synthase alpha subunit
VVIGSRLVEEIEQSEAENIIKNVEGFIRSIRKAIDQV